MSFLIETAKRSQAKLRIGLAAPSGGGKTYSALQIAYGLTGNWNKVGIIDTEQGSASLYSHLGDYKVIRFDPPFSPQRYIEAIEAFEEAGMDVIIVDSITHVWKGQGGVLELHNSYGGRFQDWAKTTPLYQRFLDAILQSKAHVITTIRKKESYAMSNDQGRTKVVKQGLDDEIRDGFSYELTVAFDITIGHIAEASKDRTGLFMKGSIPQAGFTITTDTGKILKDWAESGDKIVPVKDPTEEWKAPTSTTKYISEFQKTKIKQIGIELGKSADEAVKIVTDFYKVDTIDNITQDQAAKMITVMMDKRKAKAISKPKDEGFINELEDEKTENPLQI